MKNANKYVRAFERFLVGNASEDGEWRAFCPLHEDPDQSKSPSASMRFDLGVWHCQSCGEGGTIVALYRTMREQRGMASPASADRSNVVDMKTRKPVEPKPEKPLPSPRELRFWHKTLMGKPNALRRMTEDRGLTRETLRKYKIGWDGSRFTIPVYDEDGNLVNIRRYDPRARDKGNKMISWGVGYGSGRLYGLEVLEGEEDILYAEGELDRLMGMQLGFPTITDTSGASVFKPEWVHHFAGKNVYMVYDDDVNGDKGAMKAATYLKAVAKSVWRVRLNTGIKGGDLTDFVVKCGMGADDLRTRIKEATPLFESEAVHVVPASGRRVSVEESQNVDYNEPLEMTVMVIGKQTPAFIAPRKIVSTCDMNAGAACNLCPLMANEGKMELEIHRDDPRLMNFVNVSSSNKDRAYSEMTGAMCSKHVTHDIAASYNIEELVITPSIDHRTEENDTPIQRRVLNVGTYATPINQTARIIGKQVPDPATQRGMMMGWDLTPVNTDLDDFQMTPDVMRRLKRFQVKEGQTPLKKCFQIARDLSLNVTHIYGREMLHVAYDLVWHSVLSFNFDRKPVRKGWLECLVIGDTRTGKSEAVTALRKHYGAGAITSCEGASFAGLVGGAENVPGARSGWMIKWGTLPLNDRRLVVADEMSGLMAVKDRNILGDMSSIRSEGKAIITKIVKDETSARTRIIWLSNPADGAKISDQPGSALRAIKRMVKNPEDIARFDFAMAVANNEVPSSVINSSKHSVVKHRYTSDLCHELIMWAWSRKSDQVMWSRGTEQAVYDAAEAMGERYVNDPPLIQIENVRVKIARVAVAIAARVFSCNKNGTKVLVKKEHIESAVEFLDMIYGNEAMGYLRESRRIILTRQEAQDAKKKARRYLEQDPHVFAAIQSIGAETFRPRDFEEQAAMTRDEANLVMRDLMEWKMVNRGARGVFRFESAMTEVLREMEDDGY